MASVLHLITWEEKLPFPFRTESSIQLISVIPMFAGGIGWYCIGALKLVTLKPETDILNLNYVLNFGLRK